jgi:O-antigen polysaccharide polymerase Wzy
MPRFAGASRPANRFAVLVILLPFLVTGLLCLLTTNEISAVQVCCSYVVLSATAWVYTTKRNRNESGFPLLSATLLMYWWYFALALFLGGRQSISSHGNTISIEADAITETMIALALGAAALVLGSKCKIGSSFRVLRRWDIPDDPRHWTWLRIVLGVGMLPMIREFPPYLLGEGGRQLILSLGTLLPSVAFVILFRNYLQGRALLGDKLLLVTYFGFRLVGGTASGWLGSAGAVMLIGAAVYLSERRTIPAWPMILLLAYVTFFQVGKSEFREHYWYSAEAAAVHPMERVTYWFNASLNKWRAAFEQGDIEGFSSLASQTLMRTSLLTQVSHVMEMTPEEVPFQHGATYRYFQYTLIPRILWPDKPSVSEANRYYQVAYGLTEESNLDRVSIAVGSLGEAYMNFGWIGVPVVMFGIGAVLGAYERIFLSENSSALLFGVGIALIPQMLVIEAQLGQYLAGIVQQMLLCAVVFAPILSRRRLPPLASQPLNLPTAFSTNFS